MKDDRFHVVGPSFAAGALGLKKASMRGAQSEEPAPFF